jgi:hypothetical protein
VEAVEAGVACFVLLTTIGERRLRLGWVGGDRRGEDVM